MPNSDDKSGTPNKDKSKTDKAKAYRRAAEPIYEGVIGGDSMFGYDDFSGGSLFSDGLSDHDDGGSIGSGRLSDSGQLSEAASEDTAEDLQSAEDSTVEESTESAEPVAAAPVAETLLEMDTASYTENGLVAEPEAEAPEVDATLLEMDTASFTQSEPEASLEQPEVAATFLEMDVPSLPDFPVEAEHAVEQTYESEAEAEREAEVPSELGSDHMVDATLLEMDLPTFDVQSESDEVHELSDFPVADEGSESFELPEETALAEPEELPEHSDFPAPEELPEHSNFSEPAELPEHADFPEPADFPTPEDLPGASDLPVSEVPVDATLLEMDIPVPDSESGLGAYSLPPPELLGTSSSAELPALGDTQSSDIDDTADGVVSASSGFGDSTTGFNPPKSFEEPKVFGDSPFDLPDPMEVAKAAQESRAAKDAEESKLADSPAATDASDAAFKPTSSLLKPGLKKPKSTLTKAWKADALRNPGSSSQEDSSSKIAKFELPPADLLEKSKLPDIAAKKSEPPSAMPKSTLTKAWKAEGVVPGVKVPGEDTGRFSALTDQDLAKSNLANKPASTSFGGVKAKDSTSNPVSSSTPASSLDANVSSAALSPKAVPADSVKSTDIGSAAVVSALAEGKALPKLKGLARVKGARFYRDIDDLVKADIKAPSAKKTPVASPLKKMADAAADKPRVINLGGTGGGLHDSFGKPTSASATVRASGEQAGVELGQADSKKIRKLNEKHDSESSANIRNAPVSRTGVASAYVKKHKKLILFSAMPLAAIAIAGATLAYGYVQSRIELGRTQLKEQKYKEAVTSFEQALSFYPDVPAAQAELGQAYIKSGDKEKALEHLNKAVELSPNDPDFLSKRAALLVRLHENKKALDDYNLFAKKFPDKLDCFYYGNFAIANSAVGNFKAAAESYTAQLKLEPKKVDAFVGRAFCYDSMNQYKLAIKDDSEAIKLDSSKAAPYLHRAWCYEQLKQFDNAHRDIDVAMHKEPNAITPHLYLARLYGMENKLAEAIAECSAASKIDSQALDTYRTRAEIYIQAGKATEALKDLQRIEYYRGMKGTFSFYFLKAKAEMLGKQYKSAINSLTKAIAVQPTDGNSFLLRAECYAKLTDYRKAVEDCDGALKIWPNQGSVYLAKADYQMLAGNTLSAQENYDLAIKYAPTNVNAFIGRGNLQARNGKQSSAADDYKKALALDPKNEYARKGLASCAVVLKTSVGSAPRVDSGDQLTAAQKAKIQSADFPTLIKDGFAALSAGKYLLARETLSRAVRLNPNDAVARRYLAITLMRDERPADAAGEFAAVASLGQMTASDNEMIAECYANAGDPSKGIPYLKRNVESNPGNGHAYLLLAKAYVSMAEFQDAQDACKKGILAPSVNAADKAEMNSILQSVIQTRIQQLKNGGTAPVEIPRPTVSPPGVQG